MTDASTRIVAPHPLRITDLRRKASRNFSLKPDAATLADLAQVLDLVDLRKLSFRGEVAPAEGGEWLLTARLGATVVQPCIVTLDPVTTRIDQNVIRRFVSEIPEEATEGEVEMPEDETLELLRGDIDAGQIMQEALTLALPDYPRAPDAALEQSTFAEPGVEPLSDEAIKPFAGLAALRDKMGR